MYSCRYGIINSNIAIVVMLVLFYSYIDSIAVFDSYTTFRAIFFLGGIPRRHFLAPPLASSDAAFCLLPRAYATA
jgi:hypothetical protein